MVTVNNTLEGVTSAMFHKRDRTNPWMALGPFLIVAIQLKGLAVKEIPAMCDPAGKRTQDIALPAFLVG